MSNSINWNLCRVCNQNIANISDDCVELSDGSLHRDCYYGLVDSAGVSTCEYCEMATDTISDEAVCYGGGCANSHAFSFEELMEMAYPNAGKQFSK